MTLRLYFHPFSSFCQKVLVALYERDVAFERVLVGTGDPEAKAALEAVWPLGKFPVLRDEGRDVTVPESSAIVEYLDRVHRGPPPLLPADLDTAIRARVWDRFFDVYVQGPLQAVVKESFRPAEARDPYGVDEAKGQLAHAWAVLDGELARRGEPWAAGMEFTLADCAAAPALFYANLVQPFAGHAAVEAYYERLRNRPSFDRAVEEARPYRPLFPLGWPKDYR